MRVKSLRVKHFMVHSDAFFEFSTTGVVLITGDNGSGKSSLIEGVCFALWNKSLRGTKPWVEGKRGSVELVTDKVRVKRTEKKLEWNLVGQEPAKWESQTHSQKALEKVVGTFDVWQRTSIFSGQDSTNFTTATDSQRKKLLETILGLEKLEKAHVLARSAFKDAKSKLAEVQAQCEKCEYQLDAKKQQLELLKDFVDSAPKAPKKTLIESAKATTQAILEELQDIDAKERAISNSVYALKSGFKKKVSDSSLLLEGKCPTCDTEFDPSKVSEVKSSLHTEREKVRAEVGVKEAERASVLQERESKAKQHGKALEELNSLLAAQNAYTASRSKAEKHIQDKEQCAKNVIQLSSMLEKLKIDLENTQKEVDKLGCVDLLLGTKGVRSYILSKTLSGIEELGNSYLSRVFSGREVRLSLSPYKEKKTGGVSESISLEVHGAGGGYGYHGTSGGERRRIDIALLLALAEIASNMEGSIGFMALDEVFDTLDQEGISSLVEIIQEISQEKSLWLISHSSFLKKTLKPAQHIHLV